MAARTPGHTKVDTAPVPDLSPILAAALEAFSENGYHGTSVRDIARRVGLTVPALYYHHENKQAILVALLDHSIDAARQTCEEAIRAAGMDPADRFDRLIESLVLFMTQFAKHAMMDAEIRSLTPDNRRLYSRKRQAIERLLTQTIEDAVQEGKFHVQYPAETARALLGMIQAVALWYRPDGKLSAQQIAARYLDIARHTVGA